MKTTTTQNIARVVLGAFMFFAGVAHLTFQRKEFQSQVPKWLPKDESFQDFVVISSGVVEILLGLIMLFPGRNKIKIGMALAIFFVLVFPGNISQYTNRIDAFSLDTDQKRLIRLFFQPVLIFWALWSTGALQHLIKRSDRKLEVN